MDHVGFNFAGGGQHEQVTFNANNVPSSFPIAPPVLFTNGTLPQLYYYSGTAAQSANQYVASGSGSTFLLGGIILKWGTFTMGSGVTSLSVSFAAAFPNNKFSVCVSATSGNGNDVISAQVDSNKSAFVAARAITTALPYYYIAIGN